jgi:hypothetical protein
MMIYIDMTIYIDNDIYINDDDLHQHDEIPSRRQWILIYYHLGNQLKFMLNVTIEILELVDLA